MCRETFHVMKLKNVGHVAKFSLHIKFCGRNIFFVYFLSKDNKIKCKNFEHFVTAVTCRATSEAGRAA
jgi:hypothetical protein